jgi:lysozyme family protein
MSRFQTCLPFTLAQECPFPTDWSNPRNFSNDAHDPGGATMCGIIQREYDIYRKSKGLPVQSVELMSQAEGLDIYENSYWLPYCDDLPVGLDLCFFDASVNEGCHEAIKILQVALDLTNDGMWGPQTEMAVKGIVGVPAMINTYTARRRAVYQMMPGFRYFGTDWLRRANEIGAEAMKMATTPAEGTV